MAKALTTYDQIKALKPTGKLERYSWEGAKAPRSLWLQMTPAGTKSWIYRGDDINHTLGRYGEVTLGEISRECDRVREIWESGGTKAERKAKIKQKEKIPEPLSDQEWLPEQDGIRLPKRPTVQQAWEHYKDNYLPKKSKRYADYQEWAYGLYVQEKFQDRLLHDLGGAEFYGLVQSLREIPTTANNVKAMLSRFWNVCKWTWTDMPANPLYLREKFKTEHRDRRIEQEEFPKFGAAWMASKSPYKAGVLWLLLTAARAGALTSMRPEHNKGTHLAFPPHYPGAKGTRRVVMPKVARELLTKLPEEVSWDNLDDCMKAILKSAEIVETEDKDRPTLHSLRHTWISFAGDHGERQEDIDAITEHSLGKVRDIYNQRTITSLLKVSEKVSKKLLKVMGIAAEQL